jgi:hypothetical protein
MRRAALLAVLLALPVAAADKGKATGSMVVSGKATPLRFAYVVEQNTLLKVIVSDRPLGDDALENTAKIEDAAAIAVQLDEKRRAEEVFFFHPDLPAGLSVRELSRFEPKSAKAPKLAGRLVLDDPGNSFTYDVTFEASVIHLKESIDPLPADASQADHAMWRLKQLGIEYNESKFRDLILRDDVDAVKLFLEAGMPVEAENALTEAVERGNPAMVKLLIDAGANVNKRDRSGGPLVMLATEKPEIMKLLIAAHADVNIANNYKVDALAEAAEQGHDDVVKMLLAAGAKVNHRNPYGGTALSVAVLRGYKDVVKTLIDAGADVQRDRKDLLELAKDKPEIRAMIEEATKKK